MSNDFIKRDVNKALFNKGIMTLSTIKDINDKFDYDDDKPNGSMDGLLVSCGQNGSYNELQYIYDQKLKPFVDEGEISENQAVQALASACFNIENPRGRTAFYVHLSEQLGITIE